MLEMHNISLARFCPLENIRNKKGKLQVYALDFMLLIYARNAIMRILSVSILTKKIVKVFVQTQKRTKADENIYCVFSTFTQAIYMTCMVRQKILIILKKTKERNFALGIAFTSKCKQF